MDAGAEPQPEGEPTTAAAAAPPPPPATQRNGLPWTVCRHWVRCESCLYGATCRYEHPQGERLRDLQAVLAKTTGNQRCGNRKKIRNSGRASCFRRFLLDTFGRDLLGSGAGVLDVAGGKGVLSFELLNLNGVRSTVVDPRRDTASLEKLRQRVLKGCYHRSGPIWRRYVHLDVPEGPDAIRYPSYIPLLLEPALYTPALATGPAAAAATPDAEERAAMQARAVRGIPRDKIHTTSTVGGSEAWTDAEWAGCIGTVRGCSVVVGLHPDGAAGAIVDFALAANKPFALMPCCVFRKQFPERHVAGRPVTTFADLVEWLVAKSPDRIQTQTLDFEGRNIVVFSTGQAPEAVRVDGGGGGASVGGGGDGR